MEKKEVCGNSVLSVNSVDVFYSEISKEVSSILVFSSFSYKSLKMDGDIFSHLLKVF